MDPTSQRVIAAAAGYAFAEFTESWTGAADPITRAIPDGASVAVIECVGRGGTAEYTYGIGGGSGGGGAYSRTTISVAGLTALWIRVQQGWGVADSVVRNNDASGTIRCLAKDGTNGAATGGSAPGGAASSGTGDLKYSGGTGYGHSYFGGAAGGGGAAGPSGNGGNGTGSAAGTSGGSPGGAGGYAAEGSGASNPAANGQAYGGGAASYFDSGSNGYAGNPGMPRVSITWS